MPAVTIASKQFQFSLSQCGEHYHYIKYSVAFDKVALRWCNADSDNREIDHENHGVSSKTKPFSK
jgi:hypothetical protein